MRRMICQYFYVITAPLVSAVKQTKRVIPNVPIANELPEVWPWWSVPECSKVGAEIKSDPRWDEWVKKCNE